MPIFNKLSAAFPATLGYITIGALIVIWTIVSAIFYPPSNRNDFFWTLGFFLTGIGVFVIGIYLGRLAQFAKKAEEPADDLLDTVNKLEQKVDQAVAPPLPSNPMPTAAPPPVTATTTPQAAKPRPRVQM